MSLTHLVVPPVGCLLAPFKSNNLKVFYLDIYLSHAEEKNNNLRNRETDRKKIQKCGGKKQVGSQVVCTLVTFAIISSH